ERATLATRPRGARSQVRHLGNMSQQETASKWDERGRGQRRGSPSLAQLSLPPSLSLSISLKSPLSSLTDGFASDRTKKTLIQRDTGDRDSKSEGAESTGRCRYRPGLRRDRRGR